MYKDEFDYWRRFDLVILFNYVDCELNNEYNHSCEGFAKYSDH